MRDDRHLVEVWLSNAEKKDTSLRDGLKRLYAEYRKKKYLIAVFESGEGDLYQSTLELLSYNKKRRDGAFSRLFFCICYHTPLDMFKIICYNDICKHEHKRQILMKQ